MELIQKKVMDVIFYKALAPLIENFLEYGEKVWRNGGKCCNEVIAQIDFDKLQDSTGKLLDLWDHFF